MYCFIFILVVSFRETTLKYQKNNLSQVTSASNFLSKIELRKTFRMPLLLPKTDKIKYVYN